MKHPVLALALIAVSLPAFAHHPASSNTGTAGPILTATSSNLAESAWTLGLSMMHVDIDGFSDAQLEAFGALDQEIDSMTSLQIVTISASYGISNNTQLNISLPYVWQNDMAMSENLGVGIGEAEHHGDISGMGDMTLLLQHSMDKIALQIGVKLDTGDTALKDQSGAAMEADHQPGSGSTDYMLGVVYSVPADTISYDMNALYILAGDGTDEINRGDSLRWNAAASFASNSNISYAVELNGEYQLHEETAGIKNENSGGHVVFLSPGIRLNLENKNSVFVSLGVPVVQSLNGTQHESAWRLILGASFGY